MYRNNYWLYIEPYVHIAMKRESDVLFYNTLNGKILEFRDEPEISELVKKLKSVQHLYVVKIKESDLKRPAIDSFLKAVKRNFMGDLLDASWSKTKPFQMMPMLNLQKDVEALKQNEMSIIKDDIMVNMHELVIYLNNQCHFGCCLCSEAYRQFTFCNKGSLGQKEFKFEWIKSIFPESTGSCLSGCTISGGNVFLYSQFERLIEYIGQLNIEKRCYIHYLNLAEGCQPSRLIQLRNRGIMLVVLLHFPVAENALASALEVLIKGGLNFYFEIMIQTEMDLDSVGHLVSKYGICDYSLHPYYNGKNLDFFRKAVFVRKNDIVESRPTHDQIFTRMRINPNYFGKLILRCNGDIYANINHGKLGNLNKDKLPDIIYQEIAKGKSWRAVRGNVEPCKRCNYELLCPSISNYESVIRKNNLCHIYKAGLLPNDRL
jgi:pseudo-rSAM protein